jgi:hypothetical protein
MAAKATDRGKLFRIVAIVAAFVAIAFLESAALPGGSRPAARRPTVTAGTDSVVSSPVSNLSTMMSPRLVAASASPGQGAIRSGRRGKASHRAPATAIVVSSRRHRSLFGRRVSVTATVSVRRKRTSHRPVRPLNGSVTFYLCARPARLPAGSAISACRSLVPVSAGLPISPRGRAHLAILGLPGGRHPIFARFRPADQAAYAASASPSLTRVIIFSRPCLSTTVTGRLRVARGQSLCIRPPGRVTGAVTVAPGGALSLSGTVVRGPVTATRARGLRICRTAITGRVSVRSATGFVEIGAGGPLPCAGNTIGSRLSLRRNHRGVAVVGNWIGRTVLFGRNTGPEPPWLRAAPIRGNHVGSALPCQRHQPVPAGRVTPPRPAVRAGRCPPLPS